MARKHTWRFSDLVDALRKSVGVAYTLRRKNKGKDIPYEGPQLTANKILVSSFGMEDLTAEQLAYNKEDQGRDAMTVLLSKAVQLGMEQGWRMLMEEEFSKYHLRVIQFALGDDTSPLRRQLALESLEHLEKWALNPCGVRLEEEIADVG